MAEFDIAETNYEDFYLSNFIGKKKFKQNNSNVEVEVVDDSHEHSYKHTYINDDIDEDRYKREVEIDSNLTDYSLDSLNKLSYGKAEQGLTIVKTDVVRHKNLACDRCEPLTLQLALIGIDKNKHIKKAVAEQEKQLEKQQAHCNKCVKKKEKKKRSKGRKFLITICAILIAFISCFLIADVLSDGYLINSVVNKIINGDVTAYYYAVEIATFSDVDSARVTSEEIRASGGSGYVVHDDLYRVIAEVYKNEKDAESVSTNLNLAGYVTNIYLFKIEEINYQLFPTSVRNATKNVLKYLDIMYTSLYNTAVSLEKQEIDYTSAREDIGMLKSQINNMLVDYESSVNNKIEDKYVQKVRMQISSMIGALDNLIAEGSKNDRLLSDIRYINTMILNTHRAMINTLKSEA